MAAAFRAYGGGRGRALLGRQLFSGGGCFREGELFRGGEPFGVGENALEVDLPMVRLISSHPRREPVRKRFAQGCSPQIKSGCHPAPSMNLGGRGSGARRFAY